MNVGEYVRTPKGIGKINQMYSDRKDTYIYLDCGITIDYITKDFTEEEINNMYPSSPQIIDLIEEDDYIRIITDTDYRNVYRSYGKLVIDRKVEIPIETFSNKFIGGIITHEQMEAIQYRVEE